MQNIKTKKYSSRVNIIDNNNLQKRLVFSTLYFLGFLMLCYVLFLGNTIFNIVERKTLETGASNLANEVGNLELNYLAKSNNIDLTLASTMGFKEVQNKHFAVRKALGSVSFNSNEL